MSVIVVIVAIVVIIAAYAVGRWRSEPDIYHMDEEEAQQMNELLSHVRTLLESDYSIEEIQEYIDKFPKIKK